MSTWVSASVTRAISISISDPAARSGAIHGLERCRGSSTRRQASGEDPVGRPARAAAGRPAAATARSKLIRPRSDIRHEMACARSARRRPGAATGGSAVRAAETKPCRLSLDSSPSTSRASVLNMQQLQVHTSARHSDAPPPTSCPRALERTAPTPFHFPCCSPAGSASRARVAEDLLEHITPRVNTAPFHATPITPSSSTMRTWLFPSCANRWRACFHGWLLLCALSASMTCGAHATTQGQRASLHLISVCRDQFGESPLGVGRSRLSID